MPKRYAIANWKMNLPPEGIATYLDALRNAAPGIVIAPPFPYLATVGAIDGVGVAAQNCAEQLSGAFTGEVSATMLRELGAQFVILGHSERRKLFHETDALVARKLTTAIETGLTPVLCVGEDLHVRDAGRVDAFLADQIKAAAAAVLESAPQIVVAYEPVWAIGTGRNATGAMCAETTEGVREAIRRFWPARHADAPILYGGSVTPENVEELVGEGRIDGFLVGGASLDSARFVTIARALGRA